MNEQGVPAVLSGTSDEASRMSEVAKRLREYEKPHRRPEWQMNDIFVVWLVATGIILVTAGWLAQNAVPSSDFFGAATGALLTLAGVVPAVIGVILVGQPSQRLGSGSVVWSGLLLLLSICVASVWIVATGISLLGLAGALEEDLALPATIDVLVMALFITLATPMLFLLLVRRLGPSESTSIVVARILRGGDSQILKDLRDVAAQEAEARRTGGRYGSGW